VGGAAEVAAMGGAAPAPAPPPALTPFSALDHESFPDASEAVFADAGRHTAAAGSSYNDLPRGARRALPEPVVGEGLLSDSSSEVADDEGGREDDPSGPDQLNSGGDASHRTARAVRLDDQAMLPAAPVVASSGTPLTAAKAASSANNTLIGGIG
jgi:hypothetical protein